MRFNELLTESIDQNTAKKILNSFIEFAKLELDLDSLPKIEMFADNSPSVEYRSFGGYGDRHIRLTISNRHVMDVCRTLAHELVHYRQDLLGQLNNSSGNDGSMEENEANAKAAVIMRKWGKKYPALFSTQSIE